MNNFQLKVLHKAADHTDKLTAWELDFVDSLLDKDEDYELSEKQNHHLNKISEKLYD